MHDHKSANHHQIHLSVRATLHRTVQSEPSNQNRAIRTVRSGCGDPAAMQAMGNRQGKLKDCQLAEI